MCQLPSKTNRVIDIFYLDDVNMFGMMCSKSPNELVFYNGEDLTEVDTNVSTAMKGLTIHSIKMLEGGSRQRKFLLVEHDESENTIFEYKVADERKRDWMVFALI